MKRVRKRFVAFALIVAAVGFSVDVRAANGPSKFLNRPESWFAGPEAEQVAANILSFQSDLGGWPKNVDTVTAPAKSGGPPLPATFDNGATMNELRFLARIYLASRNETYREAFDRGLDYILKAQYPTGGWPQSYPPDGKYHRYITFNDNSMVNIMNFIREVATRDDYRFVSAARRKETGEEFKLGIQCILKCQIKLDGKLTAWCAQHDEIDFSPRPARAYELVSLSGSESVGIVRLLMSLENPDAATVSAIEGAVAWFEKVKITGHKLVTVAEEKSPSGKDRRWVEDPGSPPVWARFYEIESGRPMYCDRDGIVKYQLSEIGYERRNGYAWLGDWPRNLLEKDYPKWRQTHR